jgi:hypothetical protein
MENPYCRIHRERDNAGPSSPAPGRRSSGLLEAAAAYHGNRVYLGTCYTGRSSMMGMDTASVLGFGGAIEYLVQ